MLRETFEKGVGIVPSKRIVEDAEELLLQDAVLVPCNEPKCEHWPFSLYYQKKKLVLYLDSLAADVVTPTSYRAVSKMASLIKELDKSTDTNQWQFVVNTNKGVKQQANGYDCGIFTCLYASCLVSEGSMIDVSSMHSFRKLMLLDYTREACIPYLRKEFNLNSGLCVKLFNWPKTDDIDEVRISCLFYGPIDLMHKS